MTTAASPEQVAAWMLAELQRTDYLYQETIVYEIDSKFGPGFTQANQNGNLGIDRKVLAAFKKITGDSVIWERGQRLWRKRLEYDEPGRQQY